MVGLPARLRTLIRGLPRPDPEHLRRQAPAYRRLFRLHRHPTDLFLLWLCALWSLWLAADGAPGWGPVVVVLAGGALARCAALAYAEVAPEWRRSRKARLPLERPLEAPGLAGLSVRDGLIAAVLSAGLALLLAAVGGVSTVLLALPAGGLAAALPWVRRHSNLGEAGVGLLFAVGTLVAADLVGGAGGKAAWLVAVATALLAAAWAVLDAAVHLERDVAARLRSLAQAVGEGDRYLAALLQGLALLALFLLGRQQELGVFYRLGLATALGIVVYQQWLLHGGTLHAYRRARDGNIAFGVAVLCGIAFHFICVGAR